LKQSLYDAAVTLDGMEASKAESIANKNDSAAKVIAKPVDTQAQPVGSSNGGMAVLQQATALASSSATAERCALAAQLPQSPVFAQAKMYACVLWQALGWECFLTLWI